MMTNKILIMPFLLLSSSIRSTLLENLAMAVVVVKIGITMSSAIYFKFPLPHLCLHHYASSQHLDYISNNYCTPSSNIAMTIYPLYIVQPYFMFVSYKAWNNVLWTKEIKVKKNRKQTPCWTKIKHTPTNKNIMVIDFVLKSQDLRSLQLMWNPKIERMCI